MLIVTKKEDLLKETATKIFSRIIKGEFGHIKVKLKAIICKL